MLDKHSTSELHAQLMVNLFQYDSPNHQHVSTQYPPLQILALVITLINSLEKFNSRLYKDLLWMLTLL